MDFNNLDLETGDILLFQHVKNKSTPFQMFDNFLSWMITSWTKSPYSHIGIVLKDQGEIKKAITYFENALGLFDSLKQQNALMQVIGNLGTCYLRIGDNEVSLQYYLKLLDISKSNTNSAQEANAYLNLSAFYLRNRNYQKSLEYSLSSLSLFEKKNSKLDMAKASRNIGLSYHYLENYDKALSFFFRSMKIEEELGSSISVQQKLNDIGNVYLRMNKLDSALHYYEKAIVFNPDNKQLTCAAYNNIGIIYRNKGENRKAIKNLNYALQLVSLVNDRFIKPNILNNLSNTYSDLNDYEQALYYNKLNLDLQDSLYQSYQNAMNIKDVQVEEQKQRLLLEKDRIIQRAQLKQVQAENMQQTILIYALVGGLLLISALFFTIIRNLKIKQKALLVEKNLLKKQQKIEGMLKEQEMTSVGAMLEGQEKERNRIAKDLHDRLGSMLSMVKVHFKSMDILIEGLRKQNIEQYYQANQLLDEACEEVRRVAHDMVSGVLSKFGLVTALEDLKNNLEKTNALSIELIDIGFESKRLEAKIEITLYRIIQELVSNVLKHSHATKLSIQLFWKEKNKQIQLIVEDNGKGFDLSSPDYVPGMGLKNIQARINSLDGELMIDAVKDRGTTVIMDVPLDNENLTI